LYVEVEVRASDTLTVTAHGEGRDLPQDKSHLAAQVAIDVAGTDALDIVVRSNIPVARGLGSSAALAAAAAAAAGSTDPLGTATHIDGHPENAAASIHGGLVTATTVNGRPVAARLPLDPDLVFVVVIPDRPLPTKTARQALPETVSHHDATFNLGRMGLLIAGLQDRARLIPAATEDRLHQPHRIALFPESPALIQGLVDAGARAACWSGAGPSLLALCDRADGSRIRDAAETLMSDERVNGHALLLEADATGLTVETIQ
jgi:homoserine kinase